MGPLWWASVALFTLSPAYFLTLSGSSQKAYAYERLQPRKNLPYKTFLKYSFVTSKISEILRSTATTPEATPLETTRSLFKTKSCLTKAALIEVVALLRQRCRISFANN